MLPLGKAFQAVNGFLVGFKVVAHHQLADKPDGKELQPEKAEQYPENQKRAVLNKKLDVRNNFLDKKCQQNRPAREEANYSGGSEQMKWPEHVTQHETNGD